MRDTLELILLQVSKSEDIDKGELDVASRLIITSVCEGLSISRAGIWLWNTDQSEVHCRLLIDKGNDLKNENLILTRQDFPHYFNAMDTERTISAHNAMTDSATFEFADVYLAPLGITSMLDVPIRHRGKMIGIICCEHQGMARQWHEDEMVFAASLADLYGRAVSANERAHYEAQLLYANQSLERKVKERTLALDSAREKLVESEKMAALGNLVAGIAHEVNTPLGIALTSVSHSQEELKRIFKQFENDTLCETGFRDFYETCTEGLELAENSLIRAAQLIKDFKRTSADQTSLETEEISLNEYIPSVCNPLRPMLKKDNIELAVSVSPEVTITTCPGIIAQLLTNLLSNAQRHAFSSFTTTQTKHITVRCEKTEKGVALTVADNGRGIPIDAQQKVFEPFYTTARNAGGTGLGLSIVYSLVTQKLGGELSLSSSPNKGTSLSIFIPNINTP